MIEQLEVGQKAPDFNLSSTTEEKIRLSDYRGKKHVLVAFYPLDFTPGWIKEITSWKEDFKTFIESETEVLAISVDHIYAHNVFAASLGTLPYPLLSDWYKTTAKNYGVLNEENLTAKRSVFLIDKEGIIRFKNTEFDADDRDQYLEVFQSCKDLCV